MEENYLFSLIVVFFFFGLSFFRKETKINFDSEEDKIYTRHDSGNTGVAEYLQKKQALLQEKQPSGVAKYLVRKEELAPISSVSKYVAKQTVLANKTAEEKKSSVERYLSNRS